MNFIKKLLIKLIFLCLIINFLYPVDYKVNLYTTIQAIINTEKFVELQVYQVYNRQEKYILLKELAKVLSATLTYYPVGKYVSFNCRGEKIYFYVDKDYFLWNKQRVKLNSDILNIKNRIFVPISILNNPVFINILNATIEYRNQENILIINWLDSINLDYYITKYEAKIEYRYTQDLHYEYNIENNIISLTFFSGKIHPKEYKLDGSIIDKITILQQNGNIASEIFLNKTLNIDDVNIKIEEYKDKVVVNIIKRIQDVQPQLTEDNEKEIIKTPESEINNNATNKYIKEKEAYVSITKGKKITIVIDPGHGGEDPGAIGKYGTKEKDINLSISKKVVQKLREKGFNALITREDDIFIPLVKRTKFANDNKADIFISIHCNASEKQTESDYGLEVYFLSETATSPDAMATEKLENEVVIKFEKQTEELTKLQKILWSMMVNEFINESSKLCSLIGNEITLRTKQKYRGVKQAGFYVLRGAQMPAVLLECGFISNPEEELKLNHNDYQELIADGIVAAIMKYYENGEN